MRPSISPPDKSQRTALRVAAEPERYPDMKEVRCQPPNWR
jgi:hypothetical protein